MSDPVLSYEDLVWVVSTLCELLEVENDALARHDAQTIRELADNKAALAQMYLKTVLPMIEKPLVLEELTPEQVEELRAKGRQLGQLALENSLKLRAEITACQRVMDTMVKAAKKNAVNTVSYGRKGAFESAPSEAVRKSLALNKIF